MSLNCSSVDCLLEQYYLSTVYSLEFIFGILGNGIVMFGYIFCMKKWTSGSIYLFNLCLSDFAFLCTLPLLIESYASGRWIFNESLCYSNRYLLHANLYTSILFLTFISIDRYLLIKFPFKDHIMQKKLMAVTISIGIWIVVMLEIAPILFFIELGNNSQCLSYGSSGMASSSLIYSACLSVTGFLIPLCTMCLFYMKMVSFLRNRNQQLTTSFSIEKPLTLVAVAVIVFFILFTPYHIMRNVRIASRINKWKLSDEAMITINSIYIITRPIAFLNSVINPVFYFLMGDNFREMLLARVRHMLRVMKCQCVYKFSSSHQESRDYSTDS
ncbi:PREDICTED: succinate receptor 1 [Nanorana parkeri]|uniref:succinate receptor 1 n=1 Tax=Nanorana parkeri TaxID=125878 RepID=UPI000854CC72|nr:PREDICTED: succinate receptor 1 [Nanorana parkeri]